MSEESKRLAFLILEHLEHSSSSLSTEQLESLDVAKQCIQEVFEIDVSADRDLLRDPDGATLQDIVSDFFRRRTLLKANVDPEMRKRAEVLKIQGNEFLASLQFDFAIDRYTKAIEIDPKCPVYFSNRAAAYSQMGNFEAAVEDAEKSILIDPCFCKGYSRLGQARFALGDYAAASDAYNRGLELEPTNVTMRRALTHCEDNLNKKNNSNDDINDSNMADGVREMTGTSDNKSSRNNKNSTNSNANSGLGGLMNNPALMQMAEQMMGKNPQLAQMAQQFMAKNPNMDGLGGAGGISEMLKNPEMMKMAQQAISDPNFASKMSSMMGETSKK